MVSLVCFLRNHSEFLIGSVVLIVEMGSCNLLTLDDLGDRMFLNERIFRRYKCMIILEMRCKKMNNLWYFLCISRICINSLQKFGGGKYWTVMSG